MLGDYAFEVATTSPWSQWVNQTQQCSLSSLCFIRIVRKYWGTCFNITVAPVFHKFSIYNVICYNWSQTKKRIKIDESFYCWEKQTIILYERISRWTRGYFNFLHHKLFLGNQKLFLLMVSSWYWDGASRWNPSHGKTRTHLPCIVDGCWWPGNARSQGISNPCIDLVLLQYSGTHLERPGKSHESCKIWSISTHHSL